MVNRLVSVGDDFTLPPAVKAADANLPTRLQDTALNATYLDKVSGLTKTEAAATYASQFAAGAGTTVAAVNAWLATAYAGPKRLVGDLTLTAPLIIPSNTYLDASGATITLTPGNNGNMVQNKAFATPIRAVADAATTAASTTVTSATAAFTGADVGRTLSIVGAGPGGGLLYSTVASVTNATTAVLSVAAATTVSAASLTVNARDQNITIIGGFWDRGANGGGNNNAHSIILRRVDGVRIENMRVNSTGGKYFIALGDVTTPIVRNIRGNTSSDCIHFTGPASDGLVENVNSSSGDDIVAFTTTDYGGYNDTNGSFDRFRINNIVGANSTRLVLLGNSASGFNDGYSLSTFTIDGVTQTGSGATVSVGGQWGDATQRVDGLSIRKSRGGSILLKHFRMGQVVIDDIELPSGALVNVSPEGAIGQSLDSLVVRNVKKTGGTDDIVIASNAVTTIDSLIIERGQTAGGTILNASCASISKLVVRDTKYTGVSDMLALNGALIVTDLIMERVNGYSGTTTKQVVKLNGTANLKTITFNDCVQGAVDTSSGILVSVGSTATVGTVNVNRGTFTGIGRFLDIAAGAYTATLNAASAVLTGCNRIAQVSTATLVFMYSNLKMSGMVSQPIRIYGGGALTVLGSGWTGYAASAAQRSTTEVIHVIAGDFPVDASVLTKTNGDRAFNTNAALACGAGAIITDGTSWKNIYSGLTY